MSILDGFAFWIGKTLAELAVAIIAIAIGWLILWWLYK